MRTNSLYAITLAALVAGCSNSSKGLTVSASARGANASAGASSPSGPVVTSIDAGNGLTIERLRMVVKKVEVEGAPACAVAPTGPTGPTGATGPTGPTGPTGTSGMSRVASLPGTADDGGGDGMGGGHDGGGDGNDDGDDHDDCEVEGGPFLVDLTGDALTAPVHWVATIDVPFGTYNELKFKINTINSTQAGSDAGLGAMADAHASILVNGTSSVTTNGTTTTTPFTFSTPMQVAQKTEGSVVVNDSTNVTLTFDPSGWFKAADGSKLDPADPTAQGAIEANIRASIRVVQDDDHDGHDDSEEHGGSGHH